MIKERQIFRDVVVEYLGTPVISVTVDGTAKVTDLTLPQHTVRKTRFLSLPAGVIGYVPQLTTSHADIFRFQFRGTPESQYQDQAIYHYWEITFEGTVSVTLFMDETQKVPNDAGSNDLVLSPRSSRSQDTRRVYYPPMSFGYVPHIRHTVSSTNSGQIISARPVQLPPRYFKGLREHSEIRVTHEGYVGMSVYLDGEKLDDYQFDETSTGNFVTQKSYLPSGAMGQILQWVQKTGDGEISIFETDLTIMDQQQPTATLPE